MLVSSLRTTTYTYTPVTPTAVDTKKVLFKTTLPNSNSTVDGDAFVYSTQSLRDGRAAPSNAVVLQNADGSYFKIDLSTNPSSKVNMIASSGNLNLYVYNADTKTADQFTFNSTGVMTNATNLDARALSAAEISTKRDLDGNGAIGAKLDKTRVTGGVLDAVGGVFKVKVKGEDLFVVGAGLDRASTINANTSTLLNANGDAPWAPDETYVGYSAISTVTGGNTTWDIYGRTAGGSVTKFSFDANKKLTGTTVMSFADMAALEATKKRDLNGDGNYGVSDITAVDAKAGLYKGKAFGQDIFLAKSAPTNTAKTAALAVSTAGTFLNADGSAWAKPADYTVASMVNTGTALAPAYSVYTYKSAVGGSPANKNDLLRFDFAADGATGNFKLTDASVQGVAVTAVDMAKAEKDFKRDLNTDGTFGATITSTDIVGATTAVTPSAPIKTLFSAAMIGSTTYVVGNKLSTGVTGDLAKDLSSQLLGRDGKAWTVKDQYKVASLVETGNNTYDVYAYKSPTVGSADKNDIIKYSFAADGVNFKVTEPTSAGVTVTATALAAAEKSSKTDLNSDTFYGVRIDAALDTTGGLYKATALGQQYLLVGNSLTSSANAPLDLSDALLGKDGKAWKPENVDSITGSSNLSLVAEVSGYSVYVKEDPVGGNPATYAKYSFDANKTLTTGPVAQNALDMATAEKATPGRDLNRDGNFGVQFDTTFSAQGDIYKASMLGRTAYIVTTPAPITGAVGSAAQDFSSSLQTADGKAWAVKDGYRVTGAVKTSGAGSPVTYDVYAIKSPGSPAPDDTTDVIKYSFTAASGNFTVDADTAAGVKVTSAQLAAVEKSKAVNLNADGVFGITIDKTLDNTGGLYVASALGNKFVIVGASNLTSTSSNPQDLSQALLNADGTAWMPDTPTTKGALNPLTATNTLSVVSTVSGGNTTYEVYVKDGTTAVGTPTYAKYAFGSNFTMTGNRVDLSTEQVAALEKTLSRDLTGDSKYGIDITAAVDSIGGLYKGSLGARANVYFAAGANLTPGSAVASQAIDFSNALLNVDGSYFTDATATAAGVTVLKSFTSTANGAARFNVIASITGDDTKLRQYTFSNVVGADKKLIPAESKDLSLIEFAALESSKTRDLNGDGVIGARVNQTAVDRVGGLYEASMVVGGTTKKFLAVAATAAAVNTNLSTVLLNKDGTAWSNNAATSTVIKALGANNGYDVYTKVASTYTQYHFDASYTLDETKTKTLNTVELAAAEVSTERDINADNVLGARITNRIDTTAANFLSTATINSTEYVLATTAAPGNSADLSSAMIAANGTTPWKLDTGAGGADVGYTLQRVKVNGGATPTSYEVFATYTDGSARRFTFGADRVLQKTTDLTKNQMAGELLDVSTTGSVVDSDGGLFKTTVLGNTFYGQGTSADLTKTFFTKDGAAWAPPKSSANPPVEYAIGGLVTTGLLSAKTYDIYSYLKDSTTGTVTDVKKDSWDSSFNYLGQATVDPASLVAVEAKAADTPNGFVGYGRDLNGDGAVGFKTTQLSTTPVATYKGVTTAMVGGANRSTVFLIAGSDLSSGNTPTNALSLKDALLNATGTDAWALPDQTYKITAVDTPAGSSRFVYAVKSGMTGSPPARTAADLVMKFEFSKTSGKSLGDGVAVSAVELAAVEKTLATDLNGDNTIGAVVVGKVNDAANLTRDLGLMKANVNGTDFYVYKPTAPVAGEKIDLSAALLNQNGSAWEVPTTFDIKGTYHGSGADDPVEVYGLDHTTGAIKQFKFAKTYDAFGTPSTTYTVMTASSGTGTVNNMTGAQLAVNEYADAKDLNGDGAVGYKVTVGAPIAVQTGATAANSVGLGIASVSNGSGGTADQIYVAGANYATIGTTAALSTAKFALKLDATNYWKLDSGYNIQSIIKTDGVSPALDILDIYAKNGSDNYLKYSFESATPGTTPWTLKTTTAPTNWEMLTLEVSTPVKRDLNGDTYVGATALTKVTDTSNPTSELSLIKAKLTSGGSDLYVYTAMPAAGATLDLTKALLNADGSNWNPPASTFKITGTYQATAPDGQIEIYGVDTAVANSPLQQYVFAKSNTTLGVPTNTFTLLPSSSAGINGANALTGAQVAAIEMAIPNNGQDVSGDGVIGFKVSAAPLKVQTGADAAHSFGLGTATAGNSTTDQIYVVGKDYATIGTTGVPVAKAALKLDATTYWKPGSADSIKSINVNAGATTLDIYVTNNGANKKYSFTSTGAFAAPWTYAGTSTPSNWDVMTLEVSGAVKLDLNGDGVVGAGATTLTKVTDASNPNPLNNVGLIKAHVGASDLYVFSDMPATGSNIDLTKALLNQAGTAAWDPGNNVRITGTFENTDSTVEVYGVDTTVGANNGKAMIFRFTKTVNPSGTVASNYTLMDARVGTGTSQNLTGTDMATTEVADLKDLNGDGVIGFKVDTGSVTPLVAQTGADAAHSYGMGTASIKNSNSSSDQIYFVGADYGKIGTTATGATSTASTALKLDTGEYWKPDSTYDVKSIVVDAVASPKTLDVYARLHSSADYSSGATYMKYSFSSTTPGTDNWVLTSATTTPLTTTELLALELDPTGNGAAGGAASRDLNGDKAVGLMLDTVSSGVYTAHIDNQNYYLVDPAGANLATKVTENTLNLGSVLYADATTAWAPSAAGNAVTGWRAVAPSDSVPTAVPTGATHVLFDAGTAVYFDATTDPTHVTVVV